jgi:O-antigen/teichoic acid export membrane protein
MIKQFFGYLTGEVLYKIFGLAIFYILVNQLTKAEYALYGIIIANVAIFSMFIRFGQHAVMSRYYYDKEKNFDKVLGVSLSIFAITATLFLFSTIFLFNFYENYLFEVAPSVNNHKTIVFLVIGISLFSFFEEVSLSYTNARKKVFWHNFIKNLQLFVNLVIALLLSFIFNLPILFSFLIGWFFSYTIITIFSIYYLMKNHNITFSKEYVKDIVGFSIPLFLHNLSLLVMIHINKFFLNEYSNVEAVAGVTFITNLSIIISSIVLIFNKTWMPNFYQFLNLGKNKESNFLISQIYIIFSMLIFIFILINKEVIFIMSGNKYIELNFLSSIYIINVFFNFIYLYYTQFIFYLKKSALLLQITLITAVLNVIMNYFAIKYFSLSGAVIVFVLSQVSVSIFALLVVRRLNIIYLPYKTFLYYTIISTLSAFLIIYLFNLLDLNIWIILSFKIPIIAIIGYLIIKKLMKIHKYEKEFLNT